MQSRLSSCNLLLAFALLAGACSSSGSDSGSGDAAAASLGSDSSATGGTTAIDGSQVTTVAPLGSTGGTGNAQPSGGSNVATGGAPVSLGSGGSSVSASGGAPVATGGASNNPVAMDGSGMGGAANAASGGTMNMVADPVGGTGGQLNQGGAGGQGGLGGQAGLGGSVAGQAALMGGAGGLDGMGQPSGPPMHRELILYNDGSPGELIYVNNENPAMGWRITSGGGRDMQLIGNGRVMLGKGSGWDEYQLSDGARVGGVSNLSGTQATHRLADGTTMVASVSGGGILLRMVNDSGQVQRQVSYAGYSYVRLVRPTAAGNFLVTADTEVFEGDPDGNVVWEVRIPGNGLHVWKAMRLADGNTAIATGYGHELLIYNPAGDLVQTIGNTPEVDAVYPEFFADFHVMPSGNYFVVNSQADRTENRSVQLLEFDSTGTLVWQQKQPDAVRSLEAAIVLDGLDLTKLYVEPEGQLIAVP